MKTEPNNSNSLEGANGDLNQRVNRNVAVTMATTIFYLLSRLVIPPLTLKYVSLAEYGIWSYCFIIVGYLAMSAFGVTNVYIRYAARFAALDKHEKINDLLSTGILTIGSLSLLSLPIFWLFMPMLLNFFHVDAALQNTAFYLIMGTLIVFSIDQTFAAYGYILHSLQYITVEKTYWTLGIIIETILIAILLYCGVGIFSLLYAYLARTLISLTGYAIACYHRIPGLSFSFRYFNKETLKLFLNFGGIVQLSSCLGIVNRSLEKVFAGAWLGLPATGLYEVGEKFPTTSLSIPGSITAVLLPTTSDLHAKEEHGRILSLYLKGCSAINLISGSIMGFLCAFSVPIITWWLGNKEEYAMAAMIMSIFTLPYQLDVLTGPASAIFRAQGTPIKELVYGILQFVLVASLTYTWLTLQGGSFTAINWGVASMMCLSALIYFFYSNRELKLGQWTFIKKALLPGLIPYAVALMIAHFFHFSLDAGRWTLFKELVEAFIIYSLLLLPFLWLAFPAKDIETTS